MPRCNQTLARAITSPYARPTRSPRCDIAHDPGGRASVRAGTGKRLGRRLALPSLESISKGDTHPWLIHDPPSSWPGSRAWSHSSCSARLPATEGRRSLATPSAGSIAVPTCKSTSRPRKSSRSSTEPRRTATRRCCSPITSSRCSTESPTTTSATPRRSKRPPRGPASSSSRPSSRSDTATATSAHDPNLAEGLPVVDQPFVVRLQDDGAPSRGRRGTAGRGRLATPGGCRRHPILGPLAQRRSRASARRPVHGFQLPG